MTKIFIEAKHNKTPEYHFLKAVISNCCPGVEAEFIFMDGIGNLYNETILNQIRLAQEVGERVMVLVDADTTAKGYGYKKRKEEIDRGMAANAVSFPCFLYPNNHDDGDVEILMASAARIDLHPVFFGCFNDYESCVSSVKDESGNPKYNVPNLKNKLHTYMAAQKLSRKHRDRFGRGDWLFDNKDYWDLDTDALQPLKAFFLENFT